MHPPCSVEVALTDTVLRLKRKVEKVSGVHIEALILDGEVLCDEDMCAGTGIVEGCALEVELRLDLDQMRGAWLNVEDPTHAPEALWLDEAFVYARLMRTDYHHVGTAVRLSRVANKATLLRKAIIANPFCSNVQCWPDEMKADKDTVLACVSADASLLQYFSDTMRNDPDIVETALQSPRWNVGYLAYVKVQRIVEREVQKQPRHLCHAPSLQGNRRVVLSLVRKDAVCLQYASVAIQSDRSVLLQAMESGTWKRELLFRAKPDVTGDKRIMATLVAKDARYLEYATGAVLGDFDIVLAAVQSGTWRAGAHLRLVSKELQANRTLAAHSFAVDSTTLQYTHASILQDVPFLLQCLERYGNVATVLEHVPDRLKANKAFMLKCLHIDTPATLPYVPSKLQADEEFRAASAVHKPCKVRTPNPKPLDPMDAFRARFKDAVSA